MVRPVKLPGQGGLSDFTLLQEGAIPLAGEPFAHRLYYFPGNRVASWAFRGTRDVFAALFAGGGRFRGFAENKIRGLGVKASRARCAVVLVGELGGSGRQGG
jgi:hypothetical protein